MAFKTQGTQLYAINLATGDMVEYDCVTSISGIDSTIEQINVSCIKARDASFEAGQSTPGTATFETIFDPRVADTAKLYEWKQAGAQLRFAVVFGQYDPATGGILDFEDADQPTVDTTDATNPIFEIPDTRYAIIFNGYQSAFPINIAQNDVIRSTVTAQISGAIELVTPTTGP